MKVFHSPISILFHRIIIYLAATKSQYYPWSFAPCTLKSVSLWLLKVASLRADNSWKTFSRYNFLTAAFLLVAPPTISCSWELVILFPENLYGQRVMDQFTQCYRSIHPCLGAMSIFIFWMCQKVCRFWYNLRVDVLSLMRKWKYEGKPKMNKK